MYVPTYFKVTSECFYVIFFMNHTSLFYINEQTSFVGNN